MLLASNNWSFSQMFALNKVKMMNKLSIGVLQLAVCLALVLSLASRVGNFALADMISASGYGGSSAYVLHVNDQLLITVLGHDDYTKSVTILSDGTFSYPIVGSVSAAGRTIKQLTHYMEKGLGQELDDPQVTISVTMFQAPAVSVLGAVTKSGSYPYEVGWHVVDALTAAGGLSIATNLAGITVVRGGTLIQVDPVKLMSGADPDENPPLEAGDQVLVQQKDTVAANIQVTGEVKTPGSYAVPVEGETPLAAITSAGGVNDDAQLSKVQIEHDGQVSVVDLRSINKSLDAASSLQTVYPGDSILIPAIAARFKILGDVNYPQDYWIPEGATPLTISGAISLAKGTGPEADMAKVSVLRYENGSPTLIHVDLAKLFTSSGALTDIPVEPGDVIYVPTKKGPVNDGPLVFLLAPLAALMR
jgi:protein involved in polysaccharide export with SLBB domain